MSTEQTVEELNDALCGFDFALEDENLSFATIHASRGETIEDDDTDTLRLVYRNVSPLVPARRPGTSAQQGF